MRNGVFATVILFASTATAWSQEPQSSQPVSTPAAAESLPNDTKEQPASLPEIVAAPSCAPESSGCNGNQSWGSADFLLWSIKQGRAPPLVTSGTLASGGAIGPGTTTLFGGDLDYDDRLGGRFTVGHWFDCSQMQGIEGSYFFLTGPADSFTANSADLPGASVLARPFFNAITGLEDEQLVSFPGIISGSLRISSTSLLQGGELNQLCNLCCCCDNCCQSDCYKESGHRVDLIDGFRYLGLNEDLAITENLTFLPTAPAPPFTPGETITVVDRFQTFNSFYGGQIGARGEWWQGRWFLDMSGKVALGDTHQVVRISGSTVFADPGLAPVSQQGGLLALPTNIGSQSHDEFSVVPEIDINVGRQVTDHLRVFAGYTFLYWSSVVRPGDQIDYTVNPTQLPTSTGPGSLFGPARPGPLFRQTDLWAQGVNFGVEISW